MATRPGPASLADRRAGCLSEPGDWTTNLAGSVECGRRRKESLINGLRVEQALPVPQTQSETSYVVSYNGLRRTLSRVLR